MVIRIKRSRSTATRAHDPAFEDWLARARAITVRGELERRGLWSPAMLGDAGAPCPGRGGRDHFDARRIFEETARSCLDALEHALDLAKPTSRMKGSIAVKIVAVGAAEAAE